MSRFLSARFEKLVAYVPGEQPQDKSYIKLNTNESPYPPAPQVLEVLSANEINDLKLYSDPECKKLREALAEHYGVKPANLMIGNGSDEVLSFIFMAFCDKTIGVSYPDISYGFYPVYAELNGIKKSEIPLRSDLTINTSDYINAGTTVVLANPNAPTGICLSVSDIEEIVKSNPNNVVVIDEAYIDFGGESCVPLTITYDNLLVVQTYSKSRSMAGARLGYAIGSKELIADLERLRYSTNPYNLNRLTLLAGEAALKGQAYYDRNNNEIIRIRENAASEFEKMGFLLTDSKANFIFAKHPKFKGEDLYLKLKSRGILVRYFAKPRISDYLRITVGSEQQMESLLSTLKEITEDA